MTVNSILQSLPNNYFKDLILIKYLDDKNPANDNGGITPLHRATYYGQLENGKLLFNHLGDEISLDYDGRTPIHLAADEGHLEVCNFMLNHLYPGDNNGLFVCLFISRSSIANYKCILLIYTR